MQVLLTSAYRDSAPLTQLLEWAKLDRFRKHQLTGTPDDADLILFVEASHYTDDPGFKAVRNHPWTKHFPEQVFIYNEQDLPSDSLRGLYASMPRRWFNPSRQRASCYLRIMNPYVSSTVWSDDGDPHYLYSFVGNMDSKLRQRIKCLQDPRAFLEDTSRLHIFNGKGPTIEEAKRLYAAKLWNSKFVLCPRGAGASTFRFYEAMEMERVPVVISDQWVPPNGPDWDRTIIRIPERRVAEIPRLLREQEPGWRNLARASRAAWLEWFSPQVIFHRAVETLAAIKRKRRIPESMAHRLPTGAQAEIFARSLVRPVRDAARRFSHRGIEAKC